MSFIFLYIDRPQSRLNIGEVQPVSIPVRANVQDSSSDTLDGETKPTIPAKTEFNVRLESVNADGKVKVIREVKNLIPSLNLVQAKKFVEEAPKLLKEKSSKEEAERIKQLLESMGAKIVIE